MIRQIKNKKQMQDLIRKSAAGLAAVIVLVIMLGIAGSRNEKKKEAKATVNVAEETKKNNETAKTNETQIKDLLAQDVYSAQLTVLYEKYPEIEEILLNRSSYPDWLIEYFIGHEEAVNWVVGYPEHIAAEQIEIDTKAMAEVDLGNYEVRNGIPLYYQWDQRWGYASYGPGLIATDGCGTTCMSMVATGLLNNSGMTPKIIADFSYEQGYYLADSGTAWGLMSEGAEGLGIHVIEVQWSISDVMEQLNNGRPVICSMGPGDFTDQGHFIVLSGINEEGLILVNDPNSAVNSQKAWDAQVLLDQMKAMWAYEVPQ